MAGFYPDVPSWRMPWHRDGTICLRHRSTSGLYELSSAEMTQVNDENSAVEVPNETDTDAENEWYAFIFPELRDLDAYFVIMSSLSDDRQVNPGALEVSSDTTNSIDGTWSTVQNPWLAEYRASEAAVPWYRSGIHSVFAPGIKAVRFRGSASWGLQLHIAHLYGEVSPGQNPHRLEMWHPTALARCGPAYFDWGDAARSSDAERAFRVRNMSPDLTATDIIVSFATVTDTSPSYAGMHEFSTDDGATWLPQVNIGTLTPETLSGEILLRRQFTADAALATWTGRIEAAPTAWTA